MNIAVIGAGASGLIAAGQNAKNGHSVTLFEKNRKVGRKIVITGKGRCNITNSCTTDEFLQNVPCNNKFLYSAINSFTPAQTMEFFEELGVPLKTERGNRVFPVSDKATDIVDALLKFVRNSGVNIVFENVKDIDKVGEIFFVKTENEEFAFDKVIICTGGKSYPLTGSTGDGYTFAEKFGHKIIEPASSLVAIECFDEECKELQGLSLKNVRITVYENNKNIYTDFGEMVFTHFGVSGPLILSASAHMRNFGKKEYKISIDLKPALDNAVLDRRILSDFDKFKNKDFANALGDLLPRKMISVVIKKSEIPLNTKVNSITKVQREKLLNTLKSLEIHPKCLRPIEEAIVTRGGVSVKEISPNTMESKLVKGLYFAGEVLDVDAYTGGYNLQIAWSTGYITNK